MRGQTRWSQHNFMLMSNKTVFWENGFQSDEISIQNDWLYPGIFSLGHIQAPTSVLNQVHPAKDKGLALWHNGILKHETIERLSAPDESKWDTWLMARGLRDVIDGTDTAKFLSSLDGSFACFMYALEQLYCFRNEISPLFVDADLNFSSVKFKGSNSIEPGIVFGIDFTYNRLDDTGIHFTTANNPYIL